MLFNTKDVETTLASDVPYFEVNLYGTSVADLAIYRKEEEESEKLLAEKYPPTQGR